MRQLTTVAIHDGERATRQRVSKLLVLTLILLGLALALATPVLASGSAGWSVQTSSATAGLTGVTFANATDGWAVGGNGMILATTNGGATWNAQSSGTTAGLNSVDFVSPFDGWAVGASGTILATTNGGASWTKQSSHTTETLYGLSFASAADGWAVGASGTIVATTNGGATWTKQSSPTTDPFTSASFPNSSDGWAVSWTGDIFATRNGGLTWKAQRLHAANNLMSVRFVNASDGWTVGEGGTILASKNGGSTWRVQRSGSNAAFQSVSFANAADGWAVGVALSSYGYTSHGLILATRNGGVTWTAQNANTGSTPLVSVSFNDALHGSAVVADGTIVSTADGGWPMPTLTRFTPLAGAVGNSVTLTGSGLVSATAVRFNGRAANFAVRSDTQITAIVPTGATSGAISVTTPAGVATSTTLLTVLIKPTLTLKLSGLTRGVVKLGKSLTASDTVTPTHLDGKLILVVDYREGSRWLVVSRLWRTLCCSSTGTFAATYKPAKRGSYRLQAAIAKTATHTAAATAWLGFTVK